MGDTISRGIIAFVLTAILAASIGVAQPRDNHLTAAGSNPDVASQTVRLAMGD